MKGWLSLLAVLSLGLGACAATPPPEARPAEMHGHGHMHAPNEARGMQADPIERALDEVAAIHGAPGPWAVLGYRMSEHALAKLGLPRGSFEVQVVHWTPREVRYSCIADGAAAHSGASLGKLNLSLVDATAENVVTIYRDKRNDNSIALRPKASFRERYASTPREKARELGREVMTSPAEQLFEEIPAK